MKQNRFVTFAWFLILSAVIFSPAVSNAGLPHPPAPPLPLLVIPAPPPVFLIPGTYAYFAPDVDADLFFCDGYWYRPHGGGWYRSSRYSGPWGFVSPKRVPGVLIHLPPGYRNVPPGHQRIPYGQLRKNWKTWERHKHWDKPGTHGRRNNNKRGKDERPGREFSEGHGRGHGK
jgi:hypothetical protein